MHFEFESASSYYRYSDDVGISADGNLLVFDSTTTTLLGAGVDTNNFRDIYLKNVTTGQVTLISGTVANQANGNSLRPALSADGNWVAFGSTATNLLSSADTNQVADIFLRNVATGDLTLISAAANGQQANGWSQLGGANGGSQEGAVHTISDNGRYVVFTSVATNLVAGAGDVGNNGWGDIFLKDTQTGQVSLVSADSNGVPSVNTDYGASISGDGKFVVFTSQSALVAGDTNVYSDIYEKDLTTGNITLVSSTQNNGVSHSASSEADLSNDGRYVVFINGGEGLIGTPNGSWQVFLKDTLTGQLSLVSTAADGSTLANGHCHNATVSNDGRFVMFQTSATNMAPGDTNDYDDIYLKDMVTGQVTLMSRGTDGSQDLNHSGVAMFSGDGQYAAFASHVPWTTSNTWTGGDIYRVATPINSSAAGIADEVHSSISLTLPSYIENLELTGTSNINGTGNVLNNIITGNVGDNVIDGGLGIDSVSYANATQGVIISLANSGPQNTSGSGNDTLINIENLTGSDFGDYLTAAESGSRLQGGNGDDTLISGSGDDWLDGGAGSDTASYENATGPVTLSLTIQGVAQDTGGAGNDTLVSIENLTGSDFDDQLIGDASGNILDGGIGADTMTGGNGGDLYTVDNIGDVVNETGADNYSDTVVSSISYTLGNNVESLYSSGTANINGTGNGLANIIQGNSGNNTLDGGAGNDTLDGGVGADTLKGRAGNDTFIVDNVGDVVIENPGDGIDTVSATVSYTLSANVENLNLNGALNLNGIGNERNNTINGNIGNNQLDGNVGDDWLFGREGADTMNGGVGDDTYEVDNIGDVVMENPNEGTDTVMASITYTLTANVENLTLTGATNIDGTGNQLDNVIVGNSGANTVTSGLGNDQLDGKGGADTLRGGAGNDSYTVDNVGDTVIENLGEGTDTVLASISYNLGLNSNLENLTLIGFSNLNATGNELDNLINGNYGDNTLDGGMGIDQMSGRSGNDIYIVDTVGDLAIEGIGEGTDTVQSSVNYTLGVNIENLTLIGISDISGTGNSLANTITGNAGNNLLDGYLGADKLIGGAGDDVYGVDNAGDKITENIGEGTDLILSSATYNMVNAANVENLTLAGTADINCTGNGLDNYLVGNTGSNVISGGNGNDTLDGGGGADILSGGAGNDNYIIDNVGDIANESAGQGIDGVLSSVSFNFGFSALENLTLTGSSNIGGVGNSSDNIITGNSGNNTLYGGGGNDTVNGGVGTDTMFGGMGNDSYTVDNSGDIVNENVNEGADTVQTYISYTLTHDVENLYLLGGTSNINGTGNLMANSILGNSGNNQLDGGAGKDTLIGSWGNDTYVVDDIGDVVTESSGQGTDTVLSSVTYTLSNNVENLTLTSLGNINGTGNSFANTLTGNAGKNLLTGGLGNDTLNGGADVDTLVGGAGDDNYVVDNIGDVITENVGEGSDTVQSSVTYTLAANVENLTLTGRYTANAIGSNGTGNGLANMMSGNQAKNVLNGVGGNDTLNGGLGSDTLTGGTGNDSFQFDSVLGSTNIDTISDFVSTQDGLSLDDAVFAQIGVRGRFVIADGRFWASTTGIAHDASDRVIYNTVTGALSYDADGNDAGAAIQFATLTGHPTLSATDIWIV
ncbi:serralysin [Gammaproteobacteria bacterium]